MSNENYVKEKYRGRLKKNVESLKIREILHDFYQNKSRNATNSVWYILLFYYVVRFVLFGFL